MNKELLDKVIDTYRCLISCRTTLPGMKLEDAFSSEALKNIQEEHEWLKQLKVDGQAELGNAVGMSSFLQGACSEDELAGEPKCDGCPSKDECSHGHSETESKSPKA